MKRKQRLFAIHGGTARQLAFLAVPLYRFFFYLWGVLLFFSQFMIAPVQCWAWEHARFAITGAGPAQGISQAVAGYQARIYIVSPSTSVVENDPIPAYGISQWLPDHEYALGTYVLDNAGYAQKCSTAGVSGAAQPVTWTHTYSGTTDDGLGALVWTCEGMAQNSKVVVAQAANFASDGGVTTPAGALIYVGSPSTDAHTGAYILTPAQYFVNPATGTYYFNNQLLEVVATISYGTTSPGLINFGEIDTIDINPMCEMLDATSHDSAGNKTTVAGLRSFSGTAKGFHLAADMGQAEVRAWLRVGGTPMYWCIYPNGMVVGGLRWQGFMLIKDFKFSGPVKTLATAEFALEGSGPLSETVIATGDIVGGVDTGFSAPPA